MHKKILALLLALLLLLTLAACKPTPDDGPTDPTDPETPAGPQEPEDTLLNSGSISGTDITWEVHTDRVLYVKGTGALPDYDIPNDQPWYEHGGKTGVERSDKEGGSVLVTRIVIGEGITALSENAFRDFQPLVSVSLPSTLQVIPFKCFAECPNLREVTGGTGVTVIESEAFRSCASLERVMLSPLLTKVEDSAFGDVIPNNSSRQLKLNIEGTAAAWQTALDVMSIGLDNDAFRQATTTFSKEQ